MRVHKRIITVLISLMLLMANINVISYAANDDIASGTSGTCEWAIDSNGVLKISGGKMEAWDNDPPWAAYCSSIKEVKASGPVQLSTCIRMFSNCSSLSEFDFSNFDTSNVTDMSEMFYYCENIASIDFNNVDTSSVTDMRGMFYNCNNLTDLNVSNFNTSSVTDMHGMFGSCSSLTSLDVSRFDTSKVKNMNGMFSGCMQLTKLDLSNFDTRSATSMADMFSWCHSLKSLDLNNFDTRLVKSMSFMFHENISLTSLNISNFNTSNVSDMSNMFCYCSKLTSLDVSNFDTSSVTDMSAMFYCCENVANLDVSKFDTSKVEDMHLMFFGCYNVANLDVSNFDTSKVEEMSLMFFGCDNVANLDVSNFDTSNVVDMWDMFCFCKNLTSLNVSSFNTSKVTDMNSMFSDCSSLSSLDVSNFDTSSVTSAYYMFDNCTSLKVLKVGKWENSALDKVTFPVTMKDNSTGIEYEAGSVIPLINNKIYVLPGEEYIEPSKPVKINGKTKKIAVGEKSTLTASGPSDIRFKTSKKSVATVDSVSGKIKAIKPGNATITAYSKSDPNNKATCKVTVKYKLTYKMDGGKNSSKNPTWYTGTVKLNNPNKRTGCDFKGWYSDAKFNKRVKTVKNKNMTLYAKWDWHSYYIDFVKNGGSGKSYSQACRYGKEFSLPACKYTRKGYDFRGWNTKANGSGKVFLDKAKFKNLTSVDGKTIKLYAQWKPKKYSITYIVKSGAKHSNKTSYTIVTATFNLKNASCAGYDFKGWFSDSSLKKPITSIKKGSTGNKTIYSKWAAHKYTVKFDANGGKGKMANKGPWSYGLDYKLPKNSFTKDDFVFTGWNTKSDGSGKAFGDGAAVCDLVTKDGGSITLYAQWKPKRQKAMWFMDEMYITQVPDGDRSHKGTQNFDVIGHDSKGNNTYHDIFAPFDCTVVKIHTGEIYGNTVIIQSNEEVEYADGTIGFMSMAFGHDIDVSDLNVGKEIKQGEVFYQTGNYGPSTGIHSHVTCIKGKYKGDFWTENDYGNYCSPNAISPTSALFIPKGFKPKQTLGLTFKEAE